MRKQFFTLSFITGLCAAPSVQAQTLFVPNGTSGIDARVTSKIIKQ